MADLGSARAEITLDASGFARGIAAAQSQLSGFSNATAGIGRSLSTGSSGLDDFASKAERASGVLNDVAASSAVFGGAIATGITAAAVAFGSFEQEINAAGAVTGATSDQLKQLGDLALQIGADTSFGASEAARALTELAKAGVPLEDIFAGVGRAAVDLAAATGTDLTQSANILANTMATFSEEGLSAADTVDVLTAAANASSADLGDMAAGMRVLGPVATNLGVSFQDAAGAIAYFTKFGLKAADVGVSIARGLDQAARPTDEAADAMERYGIVVFDAQEKFVGLDALFENLQQSLGDVSDKQRTAALAAIFGAEAADVLNIAIQQGADGYRELADSIAPAGQAAEASAARMKGLTGAIDAMKGSIEVAAIAFGAALAPAIQTAAGFIESFANAMAGLPGPIQQIAAGAAAAAGGIALMGAAVAKTISFALDSAAAFSRMATVIRGSATAMQALSLAFSPIGLAVGVAAIAIAGLINGHQNAAQAARDQAAAIKALDDAFKSLRQIVTDLRLEGFSEAALSVDSLIAAIDTSIVSLENEADALIAAEKEAEKFGATAGNGAERAENLEKGADAIKAAMVPMGEAMRDTRVDTAELAKAYETLVEQLAAGDISPDEFTTGIADITTNLDRYKKTAKEAGDATNDLTQAQQESAEALKAAAEAQEKFDQQLGDVRKNAINAARGIQDMSSELDGIQTGYQRAGESSADALLRMERLGRLDLSDAQEEILHLSNHLDAARENIERAEGAIEQNSQDMSVWAGRIQLVDDTLGTVEDGYAALNKLVADGNLTQDEANDILEDAIYLRERSVGGLEDERAEQARQISVLADYVRAHDNANGKINEATDAQKGFLAAMQSSEGQTALQTVQLLTYLEALGDIPPEKKTEVLMDLAEADPVIKALLEDLGLIPSEKELALIVDDQASQPLRDVTATVGDIPSEKNVKVNLEYAQVGDGTDLTGATAFDLTIPTKLEAPDTSAVDSVTPATKTIPTQYEAPDTSAVDTVTPETVRVPTILNAPLTDLVDNTKPDAVHVPTILDAPDDALVTGYAPPTITIPTQLETPGYAEGSTAQGPDTITIPTVLGTPDATVLVDYVPDDVEVPVKLGPIPTTPDAAMAPVEVPVELGDVPDVPASETPAAITIPIEYGELPEVPAADVPTVVIPTTYDRPSGFVEGASLAIATVIIPTTYGAPPAISIPTPAGVTVAISADKTTFDATLAAAIASGVTFEEDDFQTSLSADASSWDATSDTAYAEGVAFDEEDFQATLSANDLASAAISAVQSAASALTGTYTVTIAADTSAAEAAIANLASMLPSSPAKKGPLAFQPSFDYVSDAFASSMGTMVKQASQSMSQVASSLNRDLALGVLSSDLAARRSMDAIKVASITGGGGVIQKHTHYHDERTFAPLDPDHYVDLLVSAKEGREAYKNIRERRRYG